MGATAFHNVRINFVVLPPFPSIIILYIGIRIGHTEGITFRNPKSQRLHRNGIFHDHQCMSHVPGKNIQIQKLQLHLVIMVRGVSQHYTF